MLSDKRRELASIINWAIHSGRADLSAHSLISEIIAEAVSEERERCAAIADDFARGVNGEWPGPAEYRRGASDVAQEIRKRQ